MHGIRRLLPIRQVAGRARSRKPQVIAHCGVRVALLAFHNRVRTQERKSVEMLLNRLHGRLPTENRVALRAVGAQLSAMDVGVAIGALLSNVGENRLGVASGARHLLMHAAERVARRVVVEFGNCANGGPTCVRVAIFAGSREGTVRTSARLSLGTGRASKE